MTVRIAMAAVALALMGGVALAQSVSMVGKMGNRALLVVDGGAPRAVAPGESHQGVAVLSTQDEQAVVEIKGQRRTLRVGDSPVSVGGGSGRGGSRIALPVGSGGHFYAQGAINGRAVQFMVDTGATSIAMGVADAERLGIDYKSGQQGRGMTANGAVTIYRVNLAQVRVGDVEVYNVDAAVLPGSMSHLLLGNSFLSRFQMRRDADLLVLERRF